MPRRDDLNKPILVEALRSTFQRLEKCEEAMPNDPALREIKSSILRAMANREVSSQADSNIESAMFESAT